jgi:alpha/beta superfamily hydrolase
MEYAVIDSMGRNKGWHMHGVIGSLDDVANILKDIQKKHPKKSIKSKVYEYTTAFGSKQIA